jgi:hypothetical protein
MAMNEFEKYIMNSIVPCYPDAKDNYGLRVLLKMDMGAGRDNIVLLARLRNCGFYILPSVPNATYAMQEINMCLSAFKTVFFLNIDLVCEAHFSRGLSVPSGDFLFGLLCFGGTIFEDSDNERWVCCNDIGEAGTLSHIFSDFRKVGFCPFTRECLKNSSVRQ